MKLFKRKRQRQKRVGEKASIELEAIDSALEIGDIQTGSDEQAELARLALRLRQSRAQAPTAFKQRLEKRIAAGFKDESRGKHGFAVAALGAIKAHRALALGSAASVVLAVTVTTSLMLQQGKRLPLNVQQPTVKQGQVESLNAKGKKGESTDEKQKSGDWQQDATPMALQKDTGAEAGNESPSSGKQEQEQQPDREDGSSFSGGGNKVGDGGDTEEPVQDAPPAPTSPKPETGEPVSSPAPPAQKKKRKCKGGLPGNPPGCSNSP